MCARILFLGILALIFATSARANSDFDNDGIHASDQCPSRPEIVNRFLDLDGCPDTILLHLAGSIVDAKNGTPVFAEVKIAGPSGGKTLSQVDRYELKTGAEGIFSVEIAAVGYKTQRGFFMLKRGQALNLIWALVRQ